MLEITSWNNEALILIICLNIAQTHSYLIRIKPDVQ